MDIGGMEVRDKKERTRGQMKNMKRHMTHRTSVMRWQSQMQVHHAWDDASI